MAHYYKVAVSEEQQKAWIDGYEEAIEVTDKEYPNMECTEVLCGGCNVEECFLHTLYHKTKISNFIDYSKDVFAKIENADNLFNVVWDRIKGRS